MFLRTQPNDRKQDEDAALAETALSVTGIIVLGTVSCCMTMSCVALCIRFCTWMFGHRGRRRRILLLRPENPVDDSEGHAATYAYIMAAGDNSINTNGATESHRHAGLDTSGVELREATLRDTEGQGEEGQVSDSQGNKAESCVRMTGGVVRTPSKRPDTLASQVHDGFSAKSDVTITESEGSPVSAPLDVEDADEEEKLGHGSREG